MRFVFTVAAGATVRRQTEEVNDHVWLPLTQLDPPHLLDRVGEQVN